MFATLWKFSHSEIKKSQRRIRRPIGGRRILLACAYFAVGGEERPAVPTPEEMPDDLAYPLLPLLPYAEREPVVHMIKVLRPKSISVK
jgi:hypothetical protein